MSLLLKLLIQCEKKKFKLGSISYSIIWNLFVSLFLFGASEGISWKQWEPRRVVGTNWPGKRAQETTEDTGISFISPPLSTVPFPQMQSHHKRSEWLVWVEGGETRNLLYIYLYWYILTQCHICDSVINSVAVLFPYLFLTNYDF